MSHVTHMKEIRKKAKKKAKAARKQANSLARLSRKTSTKRRSRLVPDNKELGTFKKEYY